MRPYLGGGYLGGLRALVALRLVGERRRGGVPAELDVLVLPVPGVVARVELRRLSQEQKYRRGCLVRFEDAGPLEKKHYQCLSYVGGGGDDLDRHLCNVDHSALLLAPAGFFHLLYGLCAESTNSLQGRQLPRWQDHFGDHDCAFDRQLHSCSWIPRLS